MSNRKHILLCVASDRHGRGGMVRQMHYLYQHWPQPSDWQFDWLQSSSNALLGHFTLLRAMMRLTGRALRKKADLVHFNISDHGSFYRHYILAKLGRWLGVHFIAHLHGGDFEQFYYRSSTCRQRRIEWFFAQARHCIVLNHAWRQFMEMQMRMPSEKITVCVNAVPEAPAHQHKSDQPHLLFLDTVAAQKGVDELIEALINLAHLPWRATIAGGGEVQPYRQRIAEAGLQNRVRFTGQMNHEATTKQFEQTDILVVPTYDDQQPLSVVEAMARGICVIATDVGSLPDIVHDGQNGLLIAPQSVQSLQTAMERVLGNLELRRHLGANARSYYHEHFHINQYILLMRAIYQSALSE